MQEHRYSFEIDASPEEIWAVMHTRPDHPDGFVGMGEFGPFVRKIEHGPVTIEILHEGDEVRFRHTTPYPAHAQNAVRSALEIIRRAASAEEYETAALQTQ